MGRRMEEGPQTEWAALEAAAVAQLSRPASLDRLLPVCLCCFLPSFEDGRAYTLLLPPEIDRSSAVGVRRTWRRSADLAKFESPVARLRYGPRLSPTIVERAVAVDRSAVEEILARVATSLIPACAEHAPIGVDGQSYLLSFGTTSVRSQYQWWETPPRGWEPLLEAHAQIERAVEEVLTAAARDLG